MDDSMNFGLGDVSFADMGLAGVGLTDHLMQQMVDSSGQLATKVV